MYSSCCVAPFCLYKVKCVLLLHVTFCDRRLAEPLNNDTKQNLMFGDEQNYVWALWCILAKQFSLPLNTYQYA